jgi:RNA polymerase sigma-70 factor (ECF subfamily)
MLQAVLGVDAARIAAAFLVSPSAMGQRLVRAKAKIRAAGLSFELPAVDRLDERLDDLLAAIYAAYGTGWEAAVLDEAGAAHGLAEEAVWLGRVLVSLLPGAPEASGLLALMLYCESRAGARRDDGGRFVPLAEQDPARWSGPLIDEAEALLTRAAAAGRFGRFQCEAAIQSVHCERRITGVTRWDALAALYEVLAARVPSIGVRVGRAAVLIEAAGAAAALAALEEIPAARIDTYQPWWVTRAQALAAAGRREEAAEALGRAIGLTEDPAVRVHLSARRDSLNAPP